MDSIHKTYMQRAIALAKKGTRLAYPNPSVGAIVVCNGKIIGEGITSAYGGPHAEVNAIKSVKDQSLLEKSTLYVTLEPCSHFGKTPPCANLIIEKKIPEIFVGCIDTFSEVSGRGVKMLLNAGKKVEVGLLEEECLDLHKRFLTFHNQQRPFVVLKWAETKDGFIDVERKVTEIDEAQPTWISNELSRQQVHQLRTQEHAILVGTNTALNDNPSLTSRSVKGVSPMRIVIDRNLRIPENYHLYNGEVQTFVFTEKAGRNNSVEYKEIDFSGNTISKILEILYQENIQSVIVEGGKQVLESFIAQDLWDEAFVFVGNSEFKKGVEAPKMDVVPMKFSKLGDDILKHYKQQQ